MRRNLYAECCRCDMKIPLGSKIYYYNYDYFCPSCFDDKLREIEKESEKEVDYDDCPDYDPNEGC